MTYGLPAWAGSADAEALARLLGLGGERDWVDYKRQCDLSSTRDLVEITKDIGAMMITGGYIVVGADDNGRPAGEVEHLELFDPATVHAKVAKYVPKPFELRVATHAYQEQSFALVYVAPHPEGFCVFEKDGTYPDPQTGRPRTVFRAGSVFARHGTASEPWNQRDIAIIKQRLVGDADRGRDQAAEALELLNDIPRRLGGSGLWLAVAVVPQYRPAAPSKTSADAAQSFMRDWAFASAPVEPIAGGTATYRQPGGIVITSQAAPADLPHWWRLALGDAGDAVGAHVLAHEVAADSMAGEIRWRGLPVNVTDGKTIPVRRDELEFRLETLLDLLTAHALNVGSGGRAHITALLLAPRRSPQVNVALLNEALDDSEQPVGWRLACARARQPIDEVAAVPVTGRVQLADMQDTAARLRAVYSLAADLLALFGIDQPTLLQSDGTLDPYGTSVDRQQIVYQHAQHLGLPVPEISPGERRRKFEATLQAAKDELRAR
jgi:hypothetical protein